jgi:(2Fe-2S) ferredoxin
MAPWNELVLACNLIGDVPPQVIDILEFLVKPRLDKHQNYERIATPSHAFFEEDQYWQSFFVADTAYFDGDAYAKLTYDELASEYKFTGRALIRKGYYFIGGFLHWLAPYCREGNGFAGYTRCDESPHWVDFIYLEKGEVYYQTVNLDNAQSIRKQVFEDGKPVEVKDTPE